VRLEKDPEETIILVGQTNVLVNHNRRLSVLSRFICDSKVVGQILTQDQKVLSKDRKDLFGQLFTRLSIGKQKGTNITNK
jgi:hypothetical protein